MAIKDKVGGSESIQASLAPKQLDSAYPMPLEGGFEHYTI